MTYSESAKFKIMDINFKVRGQDYSLSLTHSLFFCGEREEQEERDLKSLVQ